jgi:DUF4097 and DUF4098 domain-containing protein YvlB
MLKKALITSVLAAAVLSSNGTGPVSANGDNRQDSRQETRPVPAVPVIADNGILPGDTGEELREEFHQTYPLSATGRISVENLNGAVQIKVWDRASVQVDAVKKAYRRDRLNEAKIDVSSTDDNLRIKTEYPDWNQTFRGDERRVDNPAIIDYVLTVPRKAVLESVELVNGPLEIEDVEGNVKGTSINGRVTSRGLTGDVKLSTVNGQLHATFSKLDPSRTISLTSVNGSLTVVIPSDSNAIVNAGTVHGGITNDFGIQVKHGEYVGHSMEAQIGTGGPKIKLGNVNGSIRISHSQDGRALSPAVSTASDRADEADAAAEVDIAGAIESATRASNIKIKIDSARMAREVQVEASRQVNAEIRKAQREVEMVQRQLEREQVRAARAKSSGIGTGVGIGNGGNYKFTSKETKTFTVSGSPRVNVSTFDGAVTVHGWDKSEVMYTATKSAADEADLSQINIQAEQQNSAVSVIAKTEQNRSGNVAFDVYVPRNATLHVSSDDGALRLDGVSGDITLRTGDGSIEVSNGNGTLQLNTGDGRIQVDKFDGDLDARTGDGAITLDGNFNALGARTGDGAITLTVPGNSNFTVETNVDDDINNAGLSVTEDVTPSRRVRRWKVGSGGKVFVLKTGDGKISLRSR